VFVIVLISIIFSILTFAILRYFVNTKRFYNHPIYVGIMVGIFSFFICYFNLETNVISSNKYNVTFRHEKQMVGKYSETVTEIETRYNPNTKSNEIVSTTRTNYWDEPCSRKFFTEMHDHQLLLMSPKNMKTTKDSDNLIHPENPKQEWEITKHNLDKIKLEERVEFHLHTYINGKFKLASINKKRYFQLLNDKHEGKPLEVQTLFGFIINNATSSYENE